MFLFSQLQFTELIVEILILFRIQNYREGTWVVCDSSKNNTNFTKDVNNETLTLNLEPREEILDRESENYFYLCCLHIHYYYIIVQYFIISI
jgi:hypothetical protein